MCSFRLVDQFTISRSNSNGPIPQQIPSLFKDKDELKRWIFLFDVALNFKVWIGTKSLNGIF